MVLNISEIEQICNQFFAGLTPSTLVQSTNYQLEAFLNDPSCPTSSLQLISRANTQYSIYFGALGLARSYSKPNLSFNQSTVLEHKQQLLKFLFEHQLPITILTSICKAFAGLLKRFWFLKVYKEYPMQNVLRDYLKLSENNDEQRLILIVLLTNIVNTMLNFNKNESYIIQSNHARACQNFRRNYLVQIFTFAINSLRQSSENIEAINTAFTNNKCEIVERLIVLCKECFSVDNQDIGLCDNVNESISINASTSVWNEAFSPNSIRALFKLVVEAKIEIACECLSLLANFSCTRICRFESDQRAVFLKSFLDGILNILGNHSIKLSNQQFYYNFFRLITLMKTNNRVREFQSLIDYEEFLELLKTFTVTGIKSMQSSSNNLLYTINAWKPIVSAYTYSNKTNTSKLNRHILKILEVFISERLNYFDNVINTNTEDPLDDSSSLLQMLDVIAIISDVCSSEFHKFLLGCFDPLLDQLQISLKSITSNDVKLIERRLAFLVHVLSCITSSGPDGLRSPSKAHTAASIFRVFKLIALIKDTESSQRVEKLEIAIIAFLMRFENTYIQALSPHTSKLYRELNELCGISNESELMRIVFNKISTNLTLPVSSYHVINDSLLFLSDLIFDASSLKSLMALDETANFIKSCSNRTFPFLNVRHDDLDCLKIMRCRTKLFAAIGHLCNYQFCENRNENEFLSYLQHFIDTFINLKKSLMNQDSSKDTQFVIIGLARDLRGFCSSLSTIYTYTLFFECIHSEYADVFPLALEKFYNIPEVTTAILRFFEELATDRATRFNLPTFSPDGLHLVRFLTRSIYTFASNLLNLQVSIEDLYAKKLKAISICLRITYLILSQSIVNLGIFVIYNDYCVNNVLEALAALCLRIQPETELLIYPKLVESYFVLMQELAIAKIDFFIALSPQVFSYVLVTISVGLNVPDINVIMRSCSVLFSILMYIYDCDNKRKRVDNTIQLQNLVQQNMTIFDQIMETALNIVIYEQNLKLNYISDSFLLLILLNHKGFSRIYERFVQNMNLDEDMTIALSLFTEFSNRAAELSPPNSSSEFLELLMSLRRELSTLLSAPIKDSSDMIS